MTSEDFLKFVNKWVVPAGATVALLAGILGGIRYFIHAEVSDIRDDVSTLKTDVGEIKANAIKTDDRIDNLLKDALERSFPKPTADAAALHSSAKQIRSILEFARSENVKLDPTIIERYGAHVLKLANVPKFSADARDITSALLDYRTFLNQDQIPEANPLPPTQGRTITRYYSFVGRSQENGEKAELLMLAPLVAGKDTAIMQPLSSPLVDIPLGPSRVRFVGPRTVEIVLDGMRLKNVIFDGVTILYSGGPIIMDHVTFTNCTFKINKGKVSDGLVLAILSQGPSVSFSDSFRGPTVPN